MNSFIGVTTLKESNLKQESLFFDRVAITDHYDEISNFHEYRMLCEKGILYEPNIKNSIFDTPELEEPSLKKSFSCASDTYANKLVEDYIAEKDIKQDRATLLTTKRIKYTNLKMDQVDSVEEKYSISDARLFAAAMRMSEGVDATPISYHGAVNTIFQKGSSSAINVILKQIPVPSDNTPWQEIINFREDEEARGSLIALRKWVRNFSKEGLSQAETEEEIEYLLHCYKEYMKYHNIKWKNGLLKTVLTIPFELTENIVKMKWKDGINGLFSIQENKLALMEAEMEAPGREISYILKTQEKF